MINKKKLLVLLLVVLVLGVAYYLISPLFINKEVNESIDDIKPNRVEFSEKGNHEEMSEEIIIERKGSFVGQAGHRASGDVSLISSGGKYYVRLEDNFDSINGPDLFVHFGNNGNYAPETNLGALKGNIGGQNYEVPEDINPKDYNEVWIWCRAFTVPFAKAELK